MTDPIKVADLVRARIRDIKDFPKPGIVFKDMTPVFQHGPTHKALMGTLADRYRGQRIDAVVGVESRGFIVGSGVAADLGVGFSIVRKKGKLPWNTIARSYDLEYGKDTLEIHVDALSKGAKVVVVDDLLATGGTMKAACELVREAGAEVVEAAFVVELTFLKGRERLDGTPCYSLIQY